MANYRTHLLQGDRQIPLGSDVETNILLMHSLPYVLVSHGHGGTAFRQQDPPHYRDRHPVLMSGRMPHTSAFPEIPIKIAPLN